MGIERIFNSVAYVVGALLVLGGVGFLFLGLTHNMGIDVVCGFILIFLGVIVEVTLALLNGKSGRSK